MLSIKRNIKIIAIALMLSGMAVAPVHGMWNFFAKTQETLPEAARTGRLDIVKSLVEQGYSIDDEKDNEGLNALVWASRNGDTAMVKFLLAEFPNINAKDNKGLNALMWAARVGHAEIVALFLAYCGKESEYINHKDNNKWTAFMWAAFNGNIEVLNLFLRHGFDINKKDDSGLNALMWAVENGKEEIVKLLLSSGVKIDETDANGYSALDRALAEKHTKIIELLVKNGAKCGSIDKKDNNGYTAFMRAAERENWELAKLLLALGANIDETDRDGWTILMRAAARLDNEKVVSFLIENGADVNVCSRLNGCCLLVDWGLSNRVEKLLLQGGATIGSVDTLDMIFSNADMVITHGEQIVPKVSFGESLLTKMPYCISLSTDAVLREIAGSRDFMLVGLGHLDSNMETFVRWYTGFQNDDALKTEIQELSRKNKETLKLYAPYTCALRACDAWVFKKILQESGQKGLDDGFTKEIMHLPVICGNQDKVCILADQLFDDSISYHGDNKRMSMLNQAIQECPNKKIKRSLQHLMAMKWLLGQKYCKDLYFSFKKF